MNGLQNTGGTAKHQQEDRNDCQTNACQRPECLNFEPQITLQCIVSPPGPIKITSVTHDAVSLSWTGSLCSEVPLPNLQGLTPGVKEEFTVATISERDGQSTSVSATQTTDVLVPMELKPEVTTTSGCLEMDLIPHSFLISYSSAEKDKEFISTSSCSTVITGLQSDTDYTVSVSVGCHSGKGQSASITIHTNPPPPGQIKITSVSHEAVSLSWDPPQGLTESMRFRVTWKSESKDLYHSEVPVPNLCIQDLIPGMKYEFTVATINESGGQSTSVSVTQTTGVSAPKELIVDEVTTTSARLRWTLLHEVDLTSQSFRISYSSEGKDEEFISTSSCSTVITGLQPDTDYTVSVSVVCHSGKGQSASTTIHTNPPPPGPIKILSVSNDAVSLSWEPPQGLTESMRFKVTWKSEIKRDLYHSEVPVPNLRIQDLIPGMKYEFTVATINERGGQSAGVSSTKTTDGSVRHSEHKKPSTTSTSEVPSGKTYYTLAPGKSAVYSRDIETWLKPLTKEKSEHRCDVILALCLVVSRVGTDVEAALKNIPENKPTILVVMHHTFQTEYVVPDSRKFAKRDDMLIVDCLFNEDNGLLRCETNDITQSTMLKWINAKVSIKETPWSAVSSFFNC